MKQNTNTQKISNGDIYCNCCNQLIKKDGSDSQHRDYLHIEKIWDYFSSKDLTKHSFNICEACYDKWIASFCIPVEELPVDDIPMYTEEQINLLNAAYEAEFSKGNK